MRVLAVRATWFYTPYSHAHIGSRWSDFTDNWQPTSGFCFRPSRELPSGKQKGGGTNRLPLNSPVRLPSGSSPDGRNLEPDQATWPFAAGVVVPSGFLPSALFGPMLTLICFGLASARFARRIFSTPFS